MWRRQRIKGVVPTGFNPGTWIDAHGVTHQAFEDDQETWTSCGAYLTNSQRDHVRKNREKNRAVTCIACVAQLTRGK